MNGDRMYNKNLNKDRDSTDSDFAYEDDGFFSDVPTSGSLSRSQLALNKFMKKNLLYEENENDGAYFSKESTPNESVTKYDSDSAKSNESTERKKTARTLRVQETHIGDELNLTVLSTEPIREFNSTAKETHIGYNPNHAAPTRNTLSEVPDASELTDDFKYKQLRDNSLKKSVVRIEFSDIRNKPTILQTNHKSASLDNLTTDFGTAIDDEDDIDSENVVVRQKPHDGKREENRHTIHDVEWVNRTNVYPDVYAPLPYSKFNIIV